jgi:nucleoside 2-deoxyribosyltransferase
MKIYFAGPLFTPYERGYIDDCAAQLRADGFDVFVPHEHELAQSDATPDWIFGKDMDGLGPADAVLAILDGPMVDDGTACEIGIFFGQMQSDPAKKKGVVGLLTDLRGTRGESSGLNLFVEGCIRATGGEVVTSFGDALSALRRLRG